MRTHYECKFCGTKERDQFTRRCYYECRKCRAERSKDIHFQVGKNILEVTAMTTTLYLATISTWFTFTVFTGVLQIEQCLERQRDLEKRFAVDAVCVTRFNGFIMVKEEGNNVQENSLCGSGVC